MRDAKLTFSVPVQAGNAGLYNITAASSNGVVTLLTSGGTPGVSGAPAVVSSELNYGGLVTNGVTGAAMDANMDGSVTAADYVRGQILNPLYVQVAFNYDALGAAATADTITVELHGSDTSGFTPASGTLLSSFVHTTAATAAAKGDEMAILNLQSYAKFLKLKFINSATRAGGFVNVTRMHIQTGREGNL